MRQQGELKIEILERGLAQISLRGREVFLLRYPDPSPFTAQTGNPRLAKGGELTPGHGDAAPPNPSDKTKPKTAPPASVDKPPAPMPNQWALCKQHTSIPGMLAVMEWIEMTSKTQFTAREARAHKKLRPLFATADAVKAVLETLVEYGLLIRIDGETYERSPA